MDDTTRRREVIAALLEHSKGKTPEKSAPHRHHNGRRLMQAVDEREDVIAALRDELADAKAENRRMLRHIENIERENRQLRAALTACQEADHVQGG